MDLLILCFDSGRNVTDANRVSVRESFQIAHDVLTSADGDLQIALLLKMLVAIQKRMTDQGRPYHGWRAMRQIEAPRLVIKMVAPAGSGITRRLMLNQPLKKVLGLIRPDLFTGCFMKAYEAAGQEAHSFRGMASGNSQDRAQVNRETANTLLQHGTQEICFKSERTRKLRAQTVKRVITAVVVLFQPVRKSVDRFPDFPLGITIATCATDFTTSRCRHTSHFRSCDRQSGQNRRAVDHPANVTPPPGTQGPYSQLQPFGRAPAQTRYLLPLVLKCAE